MDDPVVNYISILTDNNIIAKYREIPDEFDLKDELLADIEFERDGELPDSLRDFELNGFSRPFDLEDFLGKRFNLLKIQTVTVKLIHLNILNNYFPTLYLSREKR